MAKSKLSSKSRTSSSKKKNSKLKWWYVLPVIALVAIGGYAIVRSSEAATHVKRVDSGMQCGGRIVDKGGWFGRSCVLAGGQGASASWTQTDLGTRTRLCAHVKLTNSGKVGMRIKGNRVGFLPGVWTSSWDYYTQYGDSQVVCTHSLSNADKLQLRSIDPVTLEVVNNGGTVGVITMYPVQSN